MFAISIPADRLDGASNKKNRIYKAISIISCFVKGFKYFNIKMNTKNTKIAGTIKKYVIYPGKLTINGVKLSASCGTFVGTFTGEDIIPKYIAKNNKTKKKLIYPVIFL